MSNLLEKWGILLYRARWFTLIFWSVLIIISGIYGSKLNSHLSGYGWDVAESESCIAQESVSTGFVGRGPASLVLIVRDSRNKVGSIKYLENLKMMINLLKKEKSIDNIYSWMDAPKKAKNNMVGKDGFTTIAFVGMNVSEGIAINELPKMLVRINKKGLEYGLETYLEGVPALWGDVNVQSQKGLFKVELIVLPIVFLVLLMILRSFISALTPFIITVTSVVVGLGIAYFFSSKFDLSIFITNTIVMLGLGLGIDYAVFIVSRYKYELKRINDPKIAISRALSTSGHTVLFSGITVLLAMAALFIIPLSAIRSLAFGAIIAITVSLLSGLTLLPTVLLLLGNHINMGRLFFTKDKIINNKFWYNWSHLVMRKPILFVTIVVTGLLILGIPALDLKTFTPDATILPKDSLVKKGFNILEDSYGKGSTSTISIVIHSDKSDISQVDNLKYSAALYQNINEKLKSKYESIDSLFSIFAGMNYSQISKLLENNMSMLSPDVKILINRFMNISKDTTVIDINPKGKSSSMEARNLVKILKEEIIPASNAPANITVTVGGATSQGIDMNSVIQNNLIKVLALMLFLCYIVLLITFKSVILPLKAILMNLLSLAASYGILVFVFAKGHGANFFSITPNGYIQNYIPLLLLALLFSLSTDYEVFLLDSIKEEYDITGNSIDSVAIGLEKTGPLITGAALLMVVVFGGFAFSNMLPIQSLGFGMAVAIIIDASIIRFILVPATMRLLGKWNWWFPLQKEKDSNKYHI